MTDEQKIKFKICKNCFDCEKCKKEYGVDVSSDEYKRCFLWKKEDLERMVKK